MDVAGHCLSQLLGLCLIQVAVHQHLNVDIAKDVSQVPCKGQ